MVNTLSIRGENAKIRVLRTLASSLGVFFGAFFMTYFVASLNNPVGESYADTIQFVETLPPALSLSMDADSGTGSTARNLDLEDAPAVASEARNNEIVYTVIYTR